MATNDDQVPVPALIIIVRRRLVIVSRALLSQLWLPLVRLGFALLLLSNPGYES